MELTICPKEQLLKPSFCEIVAVLLIENADVNASKGY